MEKEVLQKSMMALDLTFQPITAFYDTSHSKNNHRFDYVNRLLSIFLLSLPYLLIYPLTTQDLSGFL